MKPNKLYSCHLDDDFLNERESKISPWKFLNNNYIITKHFVERCNERRISMSTVVNILKLGKKYYFLDEDVLTTKHIHENRGVVEKEGRLMTAVFFGKKEYVKNKFTKSSELFMFESE